MMIFNAIRTRIYGVQKMFFRDMIVSKVENGEIKGKIKVGLLTNEIPPIIYGGVATWIINFMNR